MAGTGIAGGPVTLKWGNFCLDFSRRTSVMGILNVTPDSFSDGGENFETASAIRRALQMVEEGADIIDVGGESSRPGSEPVSLKEELRRTIPVVEALSKEISVPISIDTYKPEVARQALAAGASIINDISALRFDPAIADIAADYGVPVILMHMKGTPMAMQKNPVYDYLIPEILEYLKESIRLATAAGIAEEKIIIDPGIGFGKTFTHNLEIIHHLDEFRKLKRPILVGLSRKAFIGAILGNAPVGERLEGTAAAVAISIMNGADIIRVHDVKEMVKVVRVADAIKRLRIE